ncbi:hypothetical protein IFR09_00855 [Pseudomonas syringae]|nr:hypothetical protein [Pseudomonas syringae]MBD8790645.1 hypothetical protein [Pseudomonas syringae]MBD8798882.1 hypothetical protein [Pseudomonas syringae]MBD8809709.1 hypothetical protein [Pseudomonas syringae]
MPFSGLCGTHRRYSQRMVAGAVMTKLTHWFTRTGAAGLALATATLYIPIALAADLQTASPASVAACPSQRFDVFLERFANDTAVQKAFVKTPLRSEFIDPDAQPEPSPVSELLDKAQLTFPLMPSEQQQREQGLTRDEQLSAPDQAMVRLTKADTGYQRSLFFKREACWVLYRIQDDSL